MDGNCNSGANEVISESRVDTVSSNDPGPNKTDSDPACGITEGDLSCNNPNIVQEGKSSGLSTEEVADNVQSDFRSSIFAEDTYSTPVIPDIGHPPFERAKYIWEGEAQIVNDGKVFYNPVMEFNRDLSVAVMSLVAEQNANKVFLKKNPKPSVEASSGNNRSLSAGMPYEDGIVILDALSASGLRAVRYAKEVAGVREIIANDISKRAVGSIDANIKLNKVGSLVKSHHGDAMVLMHLSKRKFDAVDLDPYGSASPFLDSAVQSVKDGGTLLVTCTDMAVLAGNVAESCYAKYGAIPLRFPASHEMALRILLQSIQAHAIKYGRCIVPQLSVFVDFYVRVIVKIITSPAKCKDTMSQLSKVYMCVSCKSYTLHPLGIRTERPGIPPLYNLPHAPNLSKCEHCGGNLQVGGPIWNGKIHDQGFALKLLEHVQERKYKTTGRRLEGILTLVAKELDVPLFCRTNQVCSRVHCSTIPLLKFRSALLNKGYKISESHVVLESVKTDAPWSFIWDIIREWAKGAPVKEKWTKNDPHMVHILGMKQSEVDFTPHPEAPTLAREILRFQPNPRPFWGPGERNLSNDLPDVERRRKLKNKPKNKKRKNKRKIGEGFEQRAKRWKEEPSNDVVTNATESNIEENVTEKPSSAKEHDGCNSENLSTKENGSTAEENVNKTNENDRSIQEREGKDN